MKISLNKHDIHAAIRGYLASRNIVTDNTVVEISIRAVKGGQPSAEISIIPEEDLLRSLLTEENPPEVRPPAFLSKATSDSSGE